MSSEPSKSLDDKGRCCGRKPLIYKVPTFRRFCSRCGREFNRDRQQVENWAWAKNEDGTFTSKRVHST